LKIKEWLNLIDLHLERRLRLHFDSHCLYTFWMGKAKVTWRGLEILEELKEC